MKVFVHSVMTAYQSVRKRLFPMMTRLTPIWIYVPDAPHAYQSVRKMPAALPETLLKLKSLRLKKRTVKEKSLNFIYKFILFLATFLTYSFSSLCETSFNTFLLIIFLAAASRTLHEGSFLTTSVK